MVFLHFTKLVAAIAVLSCSNAEPDASASVAEKASGEPEQEQQTALRGHPGQDEFTGAQASRGEENGQKPIGEVEAEVPRAVEEVMGKPIGEAETEVQAGSEPKKAQQTALRGVPRQEDPSEAKDPSSVEDATETPVGKVQVEATAPLAAEGGSADDVSAASGFQVSTFFWNVHWQCSVAARGASAGCKDRAAQRFVELARGANAQIAASIELSAPVHLPARGLHGWVQVNGPCARGSGGDSAALMFAPGWQLVNSGGGCLRRDWDTRAFAVALVKPPASVRGCPRLCVVAIHAPHSSIDNGRDEVRRVCGEAAERCALAMGDWNVPAGGVGNLWSALIGGRRPHFVEPDQRTCCWPEHDHYGVYDHLASNIPGSHGAGYSVLPYQIVDQSPVQQHKPVAARIRLP